MHDLIIILITMLAIFSFAFILVFICKHIGHILRWNVPYKKAAKSVKRFKKSKLISWHFGYESSDSDKIGLGETPGPSFQSIINVFDNGIVIRPNNSASFGIEKDEIKKIEYLIFNRHFFTLVFNCKIFIYSENSIKEVVNFVTGERIIKSLKKIFGDKVHYRR